MVHGARQAVPRAVRPADLLVVMPITVLPAVAGDPQAVLRDTVTVYLPVTMLAKPIVVLTTVPQGDHPVAPRAITTLVVRQAVLRVDLPAARRVVLLEV